MRLTIFESRLDGLVAEKATELVDRCLDAGVTSAQRLVPVDTGELRDGIEVKEQAHRDGDDVVGTYGVDDVEHALHVEFGTNRGPMQPYLRPSVDAVAQEAKR